MDPRGSVVREQGPPIEAGLESRSSGLREPLPVLRIPGNLACRVRASTLGAICRRFSDRAAPLTRRHLPRA